MRPAGANRDLKFLEGIVITSPPPQFKGEPKLPMFVDYVEGGSAGRDNIALPAGPTERPERKQA